MAEDLTPQDVAKYTKDRIAADDPDVERALAAALARVRRYCGWHVSPVVDETITLDGTGRALLVLPTLKVVELTSVTEDGVELDLANVKQSADATGILAKSNWEPWEYGFSNVEVELSHGFTAAEAEDFREAVLSLIDQATMSINSGRSGPMISKRVDDVEVTWSSLPREVENAPMDKTILGRFRLLPIA